MKIEKMIIDGIPYLSIVEDGVIIKSVIDPEYVDDIFEASASVPHKAPEYTCWSIIHAHAFHSRVIAASCRISSPGTKHALLWLYTSIPKNRLMRSISRFREQLQLLK